MRTGALLLAALLTAHQPAGATGDTLFIGQVRVEDARIEPRPGQPLQYRITHEDPGLLEAQLAGRIAAPERGDNGVSFSLDDYPVTLSPVANDSHLASSFLIDYTEAAIREIAGLIESRYGAHPAPVKLEEFVHDYIEDKNVAHGFDIASIVAQSRSGDCTEHAVLLGVLPRMYDYPAQTVLGIFVSLQEPGPAYSRENPKMKAIAKWIVNFIGGLASLYGAMIIGMNSVTMFNLLYGTIQSGDENKVFDDVPDISHVALMLMAGAILLAAGYKGPEYFAARLEIDK